MTTETIDNPTWDDVREGDIVTCEYGTPGVVGYTSYVTKATAGAARVFRTSGWRILKIVREVPDPAPDHAGAEAFTDRGVSRSDGDTDLRWDFADDAGRYYKTSDLPNPVEALPVPAKELRELMDLIRVNGTTYTVADCAVALHDATRREWKRAGIDGGLHD